jgi:hypothetical protein
MLVIFLAVVEGRKRHFATGAQLYVDLHCVMKIFKILQNSKFVTSYFFEYIEQKCLLLLLLNI